MYLIAAASATDKWITTLSTWGQVAIGLGLVIFVHELGHFLVAKACGVKCEKFYLGFDIFGLKLARFRWGETEYGIGILPLGGYVKMLGQEDNPTKAAEEFERAKLARQAADGDVLPEGEAAAETSIFDPRSYLAKSVPQRMAIISAGVIMNVIFAFLIAAAAFGLGVNESPCVVGRVLPGDPAWRAGLRPGDEIVQIGEKQNPRFRDLQSGVALGGGDAGVQFVVDRPGVEQPLHLTIHPDRSGLLARIGITNANGTTLAKHPVSPIAPLGGKDGPLHKGDVVAAVAGVNVATGADVQREFARNPGPTTITVERETTAGQTEQIAIELPGRPVKRLGLVMKPGSIVAIQDGSPAADAKLQVGDELVAIDGTPVGDPETLNSRLLSRAEQTVPLTIRRAGETQDVNITLRQPYAISPPLVDKQPLAIGTMGIAIEITNHVAEVLPGSPAEKQGIKPGIDVVAAKIPQSTLDIDDDDDIELDEVKFTFTADKPNWATFAEQLQHTVPDTKVELTLSDERTVILEPMASDQWNPERGLNFEALTVMRKAESVGEALSLGSQEAVNSVGQVYRFLRALFMRKLSPKALGGPVEIMRAAGGSARQGLPQLFMFLCMLSANLAVLNFLPIPLLDGGHMVFLLLEGLRGKPVSERVVVAFHYAGFVLLISLMAFVFLLDLHIIPRTP